MMPPTQRRLTLPIMPDLLIAADVGGTNARLRLLDAGDAAAPLAERTYGDGLHVAGAVEKFLDEIGPDRRGDVRAACFGIAGRVVDGDVRMTNRPAETITDESLANALKLPAGKVAVVNDMVAHLSGVDECAAVVLRPGEAGGNVEGIVMPGTGLGVAYSAWDGGRRVAMPSEGGHNDFAPPSDEHDLLLVWGRAQKAAAMQTTDSIMADRVSWEWFVSGPGLSRIYACFADDLKRDPMGFTKVKPKDVTAAACGQPSPLDVDAAIRATRKFLELVGARLGNLAVEVLATRGLYLGGNILNLLYDDNPQHFAATILDELTAVGPEAVRQTLTDVPVKLIRSPDSGLRGAAVLARELV